MLVDEKAENLNNLVINKLDEFCPVMTRKVSSDDQPFFTDQLKRFERKRNYIRNYMFFFCS